MGASSSRSATTSSTSYHHAFGSSAGVIGVVTTTSTGTNSAATSHTTGTVAGGGTPITTTTSSTTSPYNAETCLSSDFSKYSIEQRLRGSGRIFRGFRIRSRPNGGLFVCKVTVLKLEPETSPSSGGGTTGATTATSGEGHHQTTKTKRQILLEELEHEIKELSRIARTVGCVGGTSSSSRSHPHILPYQRWIVSEERRDRYGYRYQPIYLMRQHIYTTLSDRLVTRPFLTNFEKIWIIYQLLKALESIHSSDICHGYITTDNICVTSWNWLLLTDFATHKPTMIPDDDLSYFIDHFQEQDDYYAGAAGVTVQSTKRCHLAPERFYSTSATTRDQTTTHCYRQSQSNQEEEESVLFTTKGQTKQQPQQQSQNYSQCLTPEMDMFATGCVIAEMMLNGSEHMFELGDIMEYRSTQTLSKTQVHKLNKIESSVIRATCKQMLSYQPSHRHSASTYLSRLSSSSSETQEEKTVTGAGTTKKETKNKNDNNNNNNKVNSHPPNLQLFPKWFDTFLWPMFQSLRYDIVTPDARMVLAASTMNYILNNNVKDDDDDDATSFYEFMVGKTALDQLRSSSQQVSSTKQAQQPTQEEERGDNAKQQEKKVVEEDGSSNLVEETVALLRQIEELELDKNLSTFSQKIATSPNRISSSNPTKTTTKLKRNDKPCHNNNNNLLILYLPLILSSLRHVQRPSGKMLGLQMLLQISQALTSPTSSTSTTASFDSSASADHVRLNRIVPLLITLLEDSNASVRAMCLQVLSKVLANVQTLNPSDSLLFDRCLCKKLSHLSSSTTDEQVKVSFADSIARLASTWLLFLEVTRAKGFYDTVSIGGSSTSNSNVAAAMGAAHVLSSAFRGTSFNVAELLPSSSSSPKKNQTTKGTKKLSTMSSGISSTNDPTMTMLLSSPQQTLLTPNTFDTEFASLRETVSGWIMQIAIGGSSSSTDTTTTSSSSGSSKRALLHHLGQLSMIFGHDGTTTQILPQILAFLNDRTDWYVRASLCRYLSGACAVVGRLAVEQFVIPCLETALMDGNDHVVYCALLCLSSLVKMKLITKSLLLYGSSSSNTKTMTLSLSNNEVKQGTGTNTTTITTNNNNTSLLHKYAPLLLHPSNEVRCGAMTFVTSIIHVMTTKQTRCRDVQVFVIPQLLPFLQYQPTNLSIPPTMNNDNNPYHLCLLDPVSRQGFLDELDRLSSSMRRGGGGTTTTMMDLDDEEEEKKTNSFIHPKERMKLQRMSPYLRLACTTHATTSSSTRQKGITSTVTLTSTAARHSKRMTMMEGLGGPYALRTLTYTFRIPNQKFVELTTTMLPLDHVPYNDDNNHSQEVFRSFATMSHYYGLHNTVYPTTHHSSTTMMMMMNKHTKRTTVGAGGAGGDVTTATASMLSSSVDDLFGLTNNNFIVEGRERKKEQQDNTENNDNNVDIEKKTKQQQLLVQSSLKGEWGSLAQLSAEKIDLVCIADKVTSLEYPTLPPRRLGLLRDPTNGQPFSWHGLVPKSSSSSSSSSATSIAGNTLDYSSSPTTTAVEWKPKVDCPLAGTSPKREQHLGAVTRVAVSQDQSFFVSASHDGTCKVWETRQLSLKDATGTLTSCLTYHGHSTMRNTPSSGAKVHDVCMIENSHSVASVDSNGMVHVWRIDTAGGFGGGVGGGAGGATSTATSAPSLQSTVADEHRSTATTNRYTYSDRSRVVGHTVIRQLDQSKEGHVLCVSHYNTSMASLVTFCTTRGGIHTWDLRANREPMRLLTRPELGYITDMTIDSSSNRHWMMTSTSRGCLCLYDIRYQCMPIKTWQHSHQSPITRLTNVTSLENNKPLVYMGCDGNEVSILDVVSGHCFQTIRVLDSHDGGTTGTASNTLTSPHQYRDDSHNIVAVPWFDEVPMSRNPRFSLSSSSSTLSFGRGGSQQLPSVSPPLAAANGTTNATTLTPTPTPASHSNSSRKVQPKILSLLLLNGGSGTDRHEGPNHHLPHLITGGTDRCIRFWDTNHVETSYTISGHVRGQPRPSYQSMMVQSPPPSSGGGGRGRYPQQPQQTLLLCRQPPSPSSPMVLPSNHSQDLRSSGTSTPTTSQPTTNNNNFVLQQQQQQQHQHRGPTKTEYSHHDAVLDLKLIEYPTKCLLSCSQDGSIKIWR